MIHISRSKKFPDLPIYCKKIQKGRKRFNYRYKGEELSDAEYEAKIAFDLYNDEHNYEIVEGRRQLTSHARKFDFWVYKQKAIRAELYRIFRGKCAYCEYEIGVRSDFDIEHFRPKKAVVDSTTGELKEPGYYWLAADWNNLLPSCQYCNQEREHSVTIKGKTGKYQLGKMNQFPLADESKRLSRPDQSLKEEEEYRLLINPCVDYPEEHMYFVTHNKNKDEEMGSVMPISHSGAPDPKGATSIIVYALNSKTLVDKRHQHINDLILLLKRLSDRAADYYAASIKKNNSEIEKKEQELRESIQELHGKLHPNAMFLGLTRQIIQEYDDRQEFATIKAFGINPMEMVKKSIEATSKSSGEEVAGQ
jgi:uncharacterized protein (TIGR02646 family)